MSETYCEFDAFDSMEDWVHVDELKKYDDAKDQLEELIHQIYNIGNVNALEDALEDLAGIFDIKLPNKEPKLVKKKSESFDLSIQFITAKINTLKKGDNI